MDSQKIIGGSDVEAWAIAAFTGLLLVFLLLPIMMVLAMSFTAATTLQFPPPGWSFRWYGEVWEMLKNPENDFSRLKDSMLVSVAIAGLASLTCLIAGVPASYALVRFQFRGRRVVEELLLSVPIIFPTVVLGVALLVIISMTGLNIGIFQIVIAHSIIGLPFMMRNCVTAIKAVDPALQEAAKTLGASSVRAFFETTFPLARGGISSGVLLVFVLSFNEFTLSFFLATIDVFPLSMWLYQESNTSFNPAIFAISSLMIVFNIVVILVVDKIVGGQSRTA